MIYGLLIFVPILIGTIIYLFKGKLYIQLSIMSIIFEAFIIFEIIKNFLTTGDYDYYVGGWNHIISIVLHVDSYVLVFLCMTTVIWLLTMLMAFYQKAYDYKFYFFFNFLRGSFYALILSNELFNIFVLLEVITIISTILIIYQKDGESLRSGIFYLLFNSTGMLFYLLGLIVLYLRKGSLNLSILNDLPFDGTIKFALSLIIVSLGVKSAFFPVNNWLPKAHMAAAPEVASLSSSLLVKAGFIVFFKFERFLDLSSFSNLLIAIGFITAITGFIFAISQDDIKGVLAFSTISQAGLILIGLSGSGILFLGGFLHLINHAMMKSLLFLSVGIIINKYHLKDIHEIRGVFRKLPFLSLMIFVGLLTITGFPHTSGFVSKYLIKSGLAYNDFYEPLIHLINIGTITMFIKMAVIFKGRSKNDKIRSTVSQNLIIGLFTILIIAMGIAEIYLLNTYFAINVSVSYLDYLYYLGYVIIGFIIYSLLIKKEAKVLYNLRTYELNFRDANILLVIFALSVMIFTV